MNCFKGYFTTLLFILCIFKDGLAKPIDDPIGTMQEEVPADDNLNEESYPNSVNKEGEQKLPFLPSEEKQSSTSSFSGSNLFDMSGLNRSSSGPIIYLGSLQLMSIPMPNMGDIMGMIGNLPNFNLPNLGNIFAPSEQAPS